MSSNTSQDPRPIEGDRFYSVADIADAVGISRKAVRAAIRRGDLKTHKFQGARGYRIRGVDLDAWIDASCIKPDAPAVAEPVRPELAELARRRPRRTTPASSSGGRLPTTPNRRVA